MEKNINKKLFAGFLALSAGFVLAGCDPVDTLPAENYNKPILVDGNNQVVDTKDNIMGKIYDEISGNLNDKVLEKILSDLATSKYGTYTEIMTAQAGNDAAKLSYMQKYNEVFDRGEGDTDELKLGRFKVFVEDITNRISETFYSLINSSTYNDPITGMFDEEKLYDKLTEELWDLQPKTGVTWNKFYVTSELTKENAIEHVNKALYSYAEDQDITAEIDGRPVTNKARGYIEKKVFPSILKDKLVEEYIYNENYSALGRSFARKVNYVKVPYTTSNVNYINFVMESFVNTFVYSTINAQKTNEQLQFDFIDKTLLGFEGVNKNITSSNNVLIETSQVGGTYVPFVSDEYKTNSNAVNKNYYDTKLNPVQKEDKPLITVDPTSDDFETLDGMKIFSTTGTVTLYPDTKLGQLLDSYNKAINAKNQGFTATEEDKAELAKFEGDSLADSLREKIIALAKEDNTTDGWFVKNGGVTELPAALRDRLFNIKVANDLETGYKLETIADKEKGIYRYDANGSLISKVPYARNIEGRKYIMAANAEDFNINNNNFIYSEGDALYICQVLEAPSTPKLNDKDAKTAYLDAQGNVDTLKIEQFARQIANILSTKDTYITNAYTKYLADKDGNNTFVFYSTSLHDYLKSQYPDLFDNED